MQTISEVQPDIGVHFSVTLNSLPFEATLSCIVMILHLPHIIGRYALMIWATTSQYGTGTDSCVSLIKRSNKIP